MTDSLPPKTTRWSGYSPLGDLNDSSYPAFIADVGALAMGSSTYEWMLRNAQKVAAETGSPWPYTQPVWIFSSRKLPLTDCANIRFVSGDMRQVHADVRAAAAGKNIWIVGGGDLAGQFYVAGQEKGSRNYSFLLRVAVLACGAILASE